MNRREENYALDLLERIRDETHENNILLRQNNIMLKQIIKYLRHEAANANKENIDDFGRNILANLFSNVNNFNRRR